MTRYGTPKAMLRCAVAMSALMGGSSVVMAQDAITATTPPVSATVVSPSAPTQGVQSAAPAASTYDAGDIIVTAQKREQSINAVGLTVTAITGDALSNKQINNVADLAQTIPGLSFTQSATNTPVYTLRGVGFYETTLSAYPDVSVYVDEIALPLPVLTTNSGFDLERVEVLKGPQGTLFGNNATGGAINYIAAKPTDDLEAGMTAGYGRFNTFTGDAYISGPLTDTLKARISGKVVHSDDWQRGYTNGNTTGATRTYAGRFLLDWNPIKAVRFELNLNAWQDDSDPQAEQYIQYRPNVPTPAGTVLAIQSYPYAPQDPRAADFGPLKPFGRRSFKQAALRGDIDITSGITLTSLTSYIDYKRNTAFDGDGVTLSDFDVTSAIGRVKSFSQELRLAHSTGAFRWVAGGNYSRDEAGENLLLHYSDSTVANNGSGLTGLSGYRDNQIMKNYAGFGGAELDVGRLTFKGSARYTQADRNFEGCGYDVPGGGTAQLFSFLQNAVFRAAAGQSPGPAIASGACFTINNAGSSPSNLAGLVTGQLNEHNTSFRGGIDWKPVHGVLLYANVTKGYKAGSFPSVAAATSIQFAPVVQESVLSYEAGYKATLLGGMLQANGAAFYYDYKNKQIRSALLDQIFGVLPVLVNVPKSAVKGFELEFVAHPARGFNAYANFLYLDAKINQFTGYGGDGVFANYNNTSLPFAPKYQVATGFEYKWDIRGGLRPFFGSDLNYRSDTSAIIGPNTAYKIREYGLLDVHAGIETADGRWRFQVWGKNVTNSYYWTSVVNYYDTVARYAGRPAEYGLSLGFKFR